MSSDIAFRLLILAILLTFSGLFSGAETSLTSLNVIKVKQLKKKGIKEANTIEQLLNNSSKTLATILIGNNIVNIGATAIATELTLRLFGGKEATIFVTTVMTVLILVFGEITPKTYSNYNPEKVAVRLCKPIEFLTYIFTPILIILNRITKLIILVFGGNIANDKTVVSEEEIKTLVDVGEEVGIIERQEKEMINSIFEIGDIEVTEVMVPRIDIIYIEEEETIDNAIKTVLEYGYSRIPVINGSIDNIVGIIYAKDLLTCCYDKYNDKSKNIKNLVRPAYFVPESKKAIDLLKEMQMEKIHISIVLDEYGGTLGLVTIEDILEEIVGDIFDEYDNDEDLIFYQDEEIMVVNSKISIEEINSHFNINLPEDEFESIGGFVFNLLGRIPSVGDTVEYGNLLLKVLEVHNKRIKKIEIKKKRGT